MDRMARLGVGMAFDRGLSKMMLGNGVLLQGTGPANYSNVIPGQFPWANDWVDPETQWDGAGKAAFVIAYVVFWLLVVAGVWFREPIVKAWSNCSCRRMPGRAVDVSPLLQEEQTENRETNVGPLPEYPKDKRLWELVDDVARTAPNSVALVLHSAEEGGAIGRREISYAALSALIEEVAQAVNSVGVSQGSVVALVLGRSVAQLVGVWGVLKAGAAFLPIDHEAPLSRKQLLVEESEAAAIVGVLDDDASEALATGFSLPYVALPAHGAPNSVQLRGSCAGRNPVPRVRPEGKDMSYLIYTSGTTGQPKGILYSHDFLMQQTWFYAEHNEIGSKSVALMKSAYFWGAFLWEFFPPIMRGAKLIISTANGHKSPDYLANTIKDEKIDTLMIQPQVLDLIMDIQENATGQKPLSTIKHIVTIGSPLPCVLGNRVVRSRGMRGAKLHNFYAATETSSTFYTVPPEGIPLDLFRSKAPVGIPCPWTKVYVMESSTSDKESGTRKLTPVPTGETGEICFGGTLTDGYWKRPELTAEKFVETEAYGRLYCSGDLGRWKGSVLEVVGRNDRQVKIRGVRVEPEEIEMTLKKFTLSSSSEGVGTDLEAGSAEGTLALRQVAVMPSAEPVELVAFVSLRVGVGPVTPEQLKAFCVANLVPAYVPKFFVVLDDLPLLPNGKENLPELKIMAKQHAEEEGEVVMDSLGQMKKMSGWAIMENNVIHRCYAYWMVGVLVDHYNRCLSDSDAAGNFIRYCSPLMNKSTQPWTEILIKSVGNDQTMFGFIMLGAYQDARPAQPSAKPRVNLGLKDLFVFIIYLMMAVPFGPLMHIIFGPLAWPIYWGGEPAPSSNWNWEYMQVQSYQSDHRWYLLMVLQARIFMQIGEWVRCPGWLQSLLIIIPLVFSDAGDFCTPESTTPIWGQYLLSWVFRNFGGSCPIYVRWLHVYLIFYVWCFHFLRPIVAFVAGRLPKGPTWGAAAVAASCTIGVLMAMFHYPNYALEDGTGMQWIWFEVGVDIIQPTLFALGMAWLPLNLAWWGNTTLGCYCFHFYFRDQFTNLFIAYSHGLKWDPTGLLTFFAIIATAVLFTTLIGPAGHYLLLSPTFAYRRVAHVFRRRRLHQGGPAGKEAHLSKQ